jgi:heme exporter protein C
LALVLLAAVVVSAAPAEQTLGDSIRIVYVHVALTWAGLLGFVAAAGAGLGVLVTGRPTWVAWTQALGIVALVLFALGAGTSAIAAQFTWGGGFFAEPRSQVVLRILAVGVLVVIGGAWLPWPRVRAALVLGLVAYVAYALEVTPLTLHPRSPIASSSSAGIRAAFASLFVIFTLLGSWAAWRLQSAASRGSDRRQNASQR